MDFCDVISVCNLFQAWKKFSKGKLSHPDVACFSINLEENIFSLHEKLKSDFWKNDPYIRKIVSDPKPRVIHVASVRDRVLFQAVYQKLYQIFDKTFIYDSCASREGQGTHFGVNRVEYFARKVSRNYRQNVFVLKCDIRRFFDNIDHTVLFALISRKVKDERLLKLIWQIIASFETKQGRGVSLGNVTSQIFANIYLEEFDKFVKHKLKIKYYIRYCDDFVILDYHKHTLEVIVRYIELFLRKKLRLDLHPYKVTIRKLRQGVDFLGYVSLPHYRVLRTRTKHRMLNRLAVLARSIQTKGEFEAALPVVNSYLGLLRHCKGEKLRKKADEMFKQFGLTICMRGVC